MVPTITYNFANVLISQFVTSQTSPPPGDNKISFQDVTHMNDIWKVNIFSSFQKKSISLVNKINFTRFYKALS